MHHKMTTDEAYEFIWDKLSLDKKKDFFDMNLTPGIVKLKSLPTKKVLHDAKVRLRFQGGLCEMYIED